MKIETTDQDIGTLLSSGYYRVPRFQRPYSWDRDNIQDFWDDVVREKSPDYFIGSMVVYRDGNQRYGIVDGQQRLTTITILLCVVRDTLDQLGETELAHGIHNLIERRNIENKPEYVLSTESSYPFFQEHILARGEPEIESELLKEENNLKAAHNRFKDLIAGLVSSIEGDTATPERNKLKLIRKRLEEVRDSLLNLKIILVKLDDEDDAYIIFETLNTRGKDLALADMVKNHLTKHLRSKNATVDPPKLKWEGILKTIEGSPVTLEMDTFIHHSWLSRYDYLPAKKLFKAFRHQVTKPKAATFLDNLVSDAKHYRSLHDPDYGKWSRQERRIRYALEALQIFRIQQPTPCVLSLVRRYKNKGISKSQLEAALTVIEKFHFLSTAVTSQPSSGGISAMYASLGRRLHEAADKQQCADLIKELKEKLRQRIPSGDEFIVLFRNLILTDDISKQRSLIRYILISIHQADLKNANVDYEKMTIEHLLPQSEIRNGDIDAQVVGSLGNLLLITESLNSRLKNKSFAEKQRILEAERELPQEIATATDWTKARILDRTDYLAKLAYDRVWKI